MVVRDTDGPRPYETYSGGERARVDITLRLALAILLADRRGAESRLLAIDNRRVGRGGAAAARRRHPRGRPTLRHRPRCVALQRDQGRFDNVIEVEKVDGVSRIAA